MLMMLLFPMLMMRAVAARLVKVLLLLMLMMLLFPMLMTRAVAARLVQVLLLLMLIHDTG